MSFGLVLVLFVVWLIVCLIVDRGKFYTDGNRLDDADGNDRHMTREKLMDKQRRDENVDYYTQRTFCEPEKKDS